MNRHHSPTAASAVAVTTLLTLIGCSDSFGPRVGSQYALRSINDRPLPTSLSVGPPTDSLFTAYAAAQYRVVSDSIIAYDLREELVWRHADGSLTAAPATCWDNFPYRYSRQGEALLLAPTTVAAVPPPPIPVIRFADGELLADLTTPDGVIRLRFQLDDSRSEPCSGFMQVAEREPLAVSR
jgi:hypothetical protein